jgi:hypothetical protein
MYIRRLYLSSHTTAVRRAQELVEQSKALLERSCASTFLGVKHYDPFPARRFNTAPSFKLIDGDQGQGGRKVYSVAMNWQTIGTAPFCRDLQLAVINVGGVHALVFPCRRVLRGWVNAESNERVYVRPTHWREWSETCSALFSFTASLEQGS